MDKISKKSALTDSTEQEVMEDVKPVIGTDAKPADKTVDNNNNAKTDKSSFDPTRVDSKGSSVKQEVIAKAIEHGSTSGVGVNSIPLGSGSMRGIPYSGTDARIIDNASGVPQFKSTDRSNSRYGQKTDNTARHLTYVPSETYIVGQDGPLPLSESADKVQGSLGHPANEFARIQKASDAFPGAINYERSIDESVNDIMLDTQGSQVKYRNGSSYNDVDPTITFDKRKGTNVPYSLHRSNWIEENVNVSYDNNGTLTDYYYDEVECPIEVSGELTEERSSVHTVTAVHQAEIDRQAMAAKAGNEVQDNWSPIPFAYPQPSRDTLYLSTVEKQAGANIFIPIKMAAKAHSYQLNKASKDGMRPVSAGVELALGPTFVKSDSTLYDSMTFGPESDSNSVFNRRFTSKGAPSAIIKMMDSITKYHDRGDLMIQPRSFNMILKQGISNYKSFKIDPEVANIFDNINVFSTIDKAYDPTSPVCIMDTIILRNPYSFNELGSCFRQIKAFYGIETNLSDDACNLLLNNEVGHGVITKGSGNDAVSYMVSKTLIVDTTADHIDDLTVDQIKSLSEDIMDLAREAAISRKGSLMFKTNYVVPIMKKDSTDDRAIFVFLCYSDVQIAASVVNCTLIAPDLATETFNLNSLSGTMLFKDSIYNRYLSVYYKNRQNYYYLELRDCYTDGIKSYLRNNAGVVLKACDSITDSLKWPVHYSTKSFSAYSYLVMLSLKYMQEQRAKSMLDVLNYSNNFGYPFSDTESTDSYSILGGKEYGQSDIFEPLEVRQMNPAIALRWLYPETFTNLAPLTGSEVVRVLHPFYMSEDDVDLSYDSSTGKGSISLSHERASMSYPVTRFGVRWAYSDDVYGMTERDFRLVLDRLVSAPCLQGTDGKDDITGQIEVFKYSQGNDGLLVIPGSISYFDLVTTPRELGYLNPVLNGYAYPKADATSDLTVRESILSDYNGHPSDRVYCWVNESATPATSILANGSSVIARAANFSQKWYVFYCDDSNPGGDIGLLLSSKNYANSSLNNNTFIPFTNGEIGMNGSETQLNGDDARAIYSFAKPLWARVQRIPAAFSVFDFSGDIVTCDPYSFNYLFGMAGFRASDFKEDLYNRLTQRMSENWKFVSDPFVKDSLLVK